MIFLFEQVIFRFPPSIFQGIRAPSPLAKSIHIPSSAKVSGPKGLGGFAWPCRSEMISDCNSWAFQQVGNPSSPCHKFGSFEKLGFTEGAQKKCQQTNKTMKAFQQVYCENPQIYLKIILQQFNLQQQNVTSLQIPLFAEWVNWQPA